MNTATIQIRIDSKTKRNAQKTFSKLGLDMSSGIKMYLNQVSIKQAIPFEIRTENGFTQSQEREMIREAREALENGVGFKNARELHASIF